jgi:hypothetical protein
MNLTKKERAIESLLLFALVLLAGFAVGLRGWSL